MATINDRINGINDAAHDAMDAAIQQYDADVEAFLADPRNDVAMVKAYRAKFYARLDEIVAEAKAATDAIGPVEYVDGEWVADKSVAA